ncbi:serine phosphatase RsbU (regulator of sigma subunit) [Kitasatospora sp. SolWspMP-SS2h]|uniref:SpoIIE family protein phosphatase n=1 Tax=Kitasatospora sp. SolWspMP-SS2h TaxID=1305729 RepID=UPI000DBFD825|nr:SpoIIE family protein phosphatase [Kitasatospora sp. SolWspMP-SS2h]RAJ44875.1 serine phosphatase RsbU (regulator of sigma subunit) [Kitasatospora sp. SolWspMP-SS2h]
MRPGVPADPSGPPPRTDPEPATRTGPPPGAARPRWGAAAEALLADGLLRAVRATAAYGGVLYLHSADRRSLAVAAVAGIPLSLIEPFRRIAVAAPLPVADSYRAGRTIVLADADDTMRRYPRLAVGLPYAHASATTPVTVGDRTFGVIAVFWPAGGARPPAATRRQLRTAGNRLATGLLPYGDRVRGERPPVVVPLPAPGDGIRLGFLDWDLAERRLTADERLHEILGTGPYDGRAAALLDRIVPEDVAPLREAARLAARQGRPFTHRVRLRDPGGGTRQLDLSGHPVTGSARLVVAVVDASAAAATAAAVERLRDGVFALDPDGRVGYVNHSAELLLHAPRAELLGRRPWDALAWLADPAYEDRYRSAMLAQQPTAFLARRPPGHWLAFSLYPDAHGLTGRIVSAAPTEDTPLPEAPPAVPASLGGVYHLLQLASALTEAVTVREVADAVAEQILPGFGGQELALYLARGGRMHLVAETGYPAGFLDPFEGTPIRARLPGTEVFTTGAPIFFESGNELSAAYPGIPRDEMAAWAFLPLIASGHPVGSLILGFDRPRVFTSEDRSVLTALGGLIAQALERARLYDAESAVARGLQQALLPHRLPAVPGLDITARYLPGTRGMEIGGDWYDVLPTPDGGVVLIIGDVEGHSVKAAALMGQLRSAVRAFASGDDPVETVARRTNHLLVDLDAGLLASCCLLRLDPATRTLHVVRAGHPPPLLRAPDGRTTVLDLDGGPLLGIDDGLDFPATEIRLPPGATLVLYTDGLVESAAAPLAEGIDRLRTTLAHAPTSALEPLADLLLGQARHDGHRADDTAVLIARLTGTP